MKFCFIYNVAGCNGKIINETGKTILQREALKERNAFQKETNVTVRNRIVM